MNMSKASLRFLCEVLLSDTCTKNVTDNINAAISRLSIVRANRNVLTELIAEVVVDLASLSQGKLKVLLTSLLAVKKRKNTDRDASVAAGKRSYLSSDFLALLLSYWLHLVALNNSCCSFKHNAVRILLCFF